MNTLEEIQAAIEKLTELKAQPEPPFFTGWDDENFTDGNWDDHVSEGFDYGTAWGEWRAIHRTIDAQLAILTRAADMALIFGGHFPVCNYDHIALALARAITGDSK